MAGAEFINNIQTAFLNNLLDLFTGKSFVSQFPIMAFRVNLVLLEELLAYSPENVLGLYAGQ